MLWDESRREAIEVVSFGVETDGEGVRLETGAENTGIGGVAAMASSKSIESMSTLGDELTGALAGGEGVARTGSAIERARDCDRD
jgi:hypothetical protein